MTFSLSVSVQKTTISDEYSKETLSRRNIAITRFMDTVTLSTVDSVQNRFYIVFGVRLLIFFNLYFFISHYSNEIVFNEFAAIVQIWIRTRPPIPPGKLQFFRIRKDFSTHFFRALLTAKTEWKKKRKRKNPEPISYRNRQTCTAVGVRKLLLYPRADLFPAFFPRKFFPRPLYYIIFSPKRGHVTVSEKKNPPNYCALSPRRKPIRNEHKSLFGGRSLLAHPLLYVIFYYVL